MKIHQYQTSLPPISFFQCRQLIQNTDILLHNLYVETPSSLDFAAAKFLVGITPNGVVSFLSSSSGGRATDVFIKQDCRIANKLLLGEQVMAEQGIKVKDLLAYHLCSLAIPPSVQGDVKMSKEMWRKHPKYQM